MAFPSDNKTEPDFDSSDIVNSGPFMDALVNFLNEAALCISEVKQRTGISPGCATSVKMNEEEKEEKLSNILSTLAHKCNLELKKNKDSVNEDEDCLCPSDYKVRIDVSKETSKSRRPEVSRPRTNPMRKNRESPSGQYYMPATQSNPDNQLLQSRAAARSTSPSYAAGAYSRNPAAYATGYPSNASGRCESCPPQCSSRQW